MSETKNDAARRAAFARALTRSVFGKNYWDDTREADRKAAAKKRPKRKPSKRRGER